MSDKKLTRPHAHPLAMFLRRLLCGVLSAVWVVTASASQEPPVKSDQQILIELEQRWHEAFYQKDVALIEGILADEFVATYDDGSRGDKAKELALTAEFDQQVTSATQDAFAVRVYGDTAVVWFALRLVGNRAGAASGSDASLYRRVGASRRPVAMRVHPEHDVEHGVDVPTN